MRKNIITTCTVFCMSISFLTGCADDNIDEGEVAAAISDVYSDENGNVTMELVDGRSFDLGNFRGKDGKDGVDGKDGLDGISIVNIEISSDRHLIVTLSDGTTKDAGYVMQNDSTVIQNKADISVSDTPDVPTVPNNPSVPDVSAPSESTGQEIAAILQFDSTGTRVIGCTNMDVATYLEVPEGVTYINEGILSGMPQLKRASLPESYTEIANSLFRGCSSLREVKVSTKTTIIGDYAFNGCNLQFINLPDTVTTIGIYAFYDYSIFDLNKDNAFKEVNLSDNLVNLGQMAFAGCGLESVHIPKQITCIP